MNCIFKKLILSSAIILTTLQIQASETTNIDMFAPPADMLNVDLGFSILDTKFTDNSATDYKITGNQIGFDVSYGLKEKLAIFIKQDIYSYKLSATGLDYDFKGLSLTTFGIKGILIYNEPYLYYDLSYSNSLLQKRKDETNETNIYSPLDTRNHLTATGGFGVPFGKITVAGRYKIFAFQDTKYNDSSGASVNHKSGSGNSWKLYLQYGHKTNLGLAYGEQSIGAYDEDTSGVIANQHKSEFKETQVFAMIPISGKADIRLDISKQEIKNKADFGYTKYNSYLASFGFRGDF